MVKELQTVRSVFFFVEKIHSSHFTLIWIWKKLLNQILWHKLASICITLYDVHFKVFPISLMIKKKCFYCTLHTEWSYCVIQHRITNYLLSQIRFGIKSMHIVLKYLVFLYLGCFLTMAEIRSTLRTNLISRSDCHFQ